MAITYQPIVKGISPEYINETLTYHIEVPFAEVNDDGSSTLVSDVLADFQTEPDLGLVLDLSGTPTQSYIGIPASCAITATGSYADGSTDTWSQTVTCYICGRRFEEVGSNGTRRVIATYEGRVIGTHSISSRVQMASAPIYQSLRPNNGDYDAPDFYQGIGADFSGTVRDVPIFVYSVIECVPMAGADGVIYYDRVQDWDALAGSVNEQGWTPPWQDDYYSAFYGELMEGSYLYLGPTESQPDNRTRTVMVRHDFAVYSARANQAIYLFRNFAQWVDPTNYQLQRRYENLLTGAYIQPVAGTDYDIVDIDQNTGLPRSGAEPIAQWGDDTLGFYFTHHMVGG